VACPQTPLGGHALHAIKLSWPDHFVGACYGLGIAWDILCTYLLLQEIRFSHSNIVTYSSKVHDLCRGHVVSAKSVKGIHKTPLDSWHLLYKSGSGYHSFNNLEPPLQPMLGSRRLEAP